MILLLAALLAVPVPCPRPHRNRSAVAKGGEERPWFEVLGVPREASDETIKAAYRSLAARHHPDVGGDAEMMTRINRAYDLATQRGAQ